VIPASRPDRTRLLDLPSGRVFVVDVGPLDSPLPPLLLLHGLLVTHYSFRHLLGPLSAERRVLAIDLPGAGESDRPRPQDAEGYSVGWLAARVDDVLGELGVSTVDLLGHSFGGTVALWLAATIPARVRRLVLVDPVAFPFDLPLVGRLALLPRVGPMLFENLYRQADLRRYLRGTVSTPELLDATAVDVYWDRLGRTGGREAAHAMLKGIRDLGPLHARMADVRAPTLVVWGDRDALLPVSDGERLVGDLASAELLVIPGCGHAVPEERPDALLSAAREFFGRR
jgi:pimeloyl-ACP methyl ester carboxylesterase